MTFCFCYEEKLIFTQKGCVVLTGVWCKKNTPHCKVQMLSSHCDVFTVSCLKNFWQLHQSALQTSNYCFTV